MKVLFLSAWYPTEQDAMAGLFVQKHAEAVVRQGADVQVLYSTRTGIEWMLDMYQRWKKLKKEWGKPDIVQMNVLDKNGLIALWLKWRYRIPYIVVEHWSGYLPENFAFRKGWHGWFIRKVAKQASCILPVSKMLEDAMKRCGIQNEIWQRIHNVVDDFFYKPITPLTIPSKPENKFRLLHVSCFDENAKNIQGMLRAVRKVANQRQDFEFIIVGTGIDFERDFKYAQSLDFPEGILHFTGEQSPYEVAQWMQQSDCFILFSNYETYAVVLAEAIAVGLPSIRTSTSGIASEISIESGMTIAPQDENALSNAIEHFLDNSSNYSSKSIRSYGKEYESDNIGKSLIKLYEEFK